MYLSLVSLIEFSLPSGQSPNFLVMQNSCHSDSNVPLQLHLFFSVLLQAKVLNYKSHKPTLDDLRSKIIYSENIGKLTESLGKLEKPASGRQVGTKGSQAARTTAQTFLPSSAGRLQQIPDAAAGPQDSPGHRTQPLPPSPSAPQTGCRCHCCHLQNKCFLICITCSRFD